jgi:predicted Zn-dependent protease with MMP-like domain
MRIDPRSRRQPATRRTRRDRRGRGVRGGIAPKAVPINRSPSEAFDDLVLDAVDELEDRWSAELAGVEFAVEDVPPVIDRAAAELDPNVILDRGIPLGRLLRAGLADIDRPVVLIYRRPLEARAPDRDDRADLVFAVVAELVAEFLGRDIDEVDPP